VVANDSKFTVPLNELTHSVTMLTAQAVECLDPGLPVKLLMWGQGDERVETLVLRLSREQLALSDTQLQSLRKKREAAAPNGAAPNKKAHDDARRLAESLAEDIKKNLFHMSVVMDGIRGVLTATQLQRLQLWISQNPAFVQILHSTWMH